VTDDPFHILGFPYRLVPTQMGRQADHNNLLVSDIRSERSTLPRV